MLQPTSKESKTLFLWILLIATTLVLGLVVYFFVIGRSEKNNTASSTVTTAQAAAQEKAYAKEVRGHVLSYITKVQKLKEASTTHRAEWKTLATELHTALLNISSVPSRMQTIHLSIVLSVSQVMASLTAEEKPSLSEHVDQLNALILALG